MTVPRGQQCAGVKKNGEPCQAFRIGDWTGHQSHLTTKSDPWYCHSHKGQS